MYLQYNTCIVVCKNIINMIQNNLRTLQAGGQSLQLECKKIDYEGVQENNK